MKRAGFLGSIAVVAVFVGVLAATLPAAGTQNRTIKGVVLGKNAARHTIAVSSTRGAVRTIRVQSTRQHVGTRVDVLAKALSNGAFSALRISTVGRASLARISGATVLRQLHGSLLVSAGGSTLSIHSSRSLAALGGSSLRPGSVIDATVTISSSGLLNLASVSLVRSPLGASGATGPTGSTGPSGEAGDDDGGDDCTASGPSGPTGASGPAANGDDDEGDDDCGATGPSGPSGDEGDDQGDDDQGDDDAGGDD